jgi:hypothetical protein
MLRLYGIPVTPDDARNPVSTLIADGSHDAIGAAEIVDKGLDLYILALAPEERDTILSVLEDQLEGLFEMRGVLARDQRYRSGAE